MDNIVFFGTRGSASLTAPRYLVYGGATTCLLLRFGDSAFLVDCGSGFNNISDELDGVDEINLFVSHTHIDHVSAVPALFSRFENKKINVYGKTYDGVSVKDAVARLMSRSLWPVRADAYQNVVFHEITKPFVLNGVTVSTMDANHPGGCTLFRFDTAKDSVVTAFDFCHLDGYEEKLIAFAKGCRTLIYDGYFSEEELSQKPTWGHSTPEAGARIGEALGCDVVITHYGPYDDATLEAWENRLRKNHPHVSFAKCGRGNDELKKMVDVGTQLMGEKDKDVLLCKIIETAMDITSADGGTLYLLENGMLDFKVMMNRSKGTRFVKKEGDVALPPVPLDGKNVCAASAREKRLINIVDCYHEKDYDFSGAKTYDAMNGYRTQSVLVVPMMDEDGDVVGVIQLINATDGAGKITSFMTSQEGVLMALAGQACVSIVNAGYAQKINDLLYGFVKVMSLGIDERTPYNVNHTRNMVRFAERFFDVQETVDGKYRVDERHRREILMSIWLHDIGKILTPMEIMNKDTRLGAKLRDVNVRFDRRALLLKLFLAEGKIDREGYEALEKARQNEQERIAFINKAGFLADDLKAELDALAHATYTELDGTQTPILTEEEVYLLSIVKGTLTREERGAMEDHVALTQRFLSQLKFPKYYDNIPVYAGNHHEMLDGSGYPNHLKADDLPWPCRLITVLDIYEALTAKDRPYKKPFTPEKSFAILNEMVDGGKLDGDIVRAFESSHAWEEQN